MDGFSSHTFKWVNAKGDQFYVKYHFKSEVGNKTMTGVCVPLVSCCTLLVFRLCISHTIVWSVRG